MTMKSRHTRRQLLAGGIGAAAGLAGMSAGAEADSASQGQSAALPTWAQDGDTLQTLLAYEHMLEFSAERALGSGKLGQDGRDLVLLILAHEEQHVAALQARLRALRLPRKQSQNPAPSTSQQFTDLYKQVVGLFSDIQHEIPALQALVQVENLVQSAYFVATGTFHDPRLSLLAAEILAVEAQQWALLEALLHRGDPTKAVPHPAIRGSQTIGTPHSTNSS